jgi:alanyl-tRNA synthetase
VLDRPLPIKKDRHEYKGETVSGTVDEDRRNQLRNNHTATHIVFAACRKVLGPHVWQNGAKKSTEKAHLDITHFKALTHEEILGIENEANRIVQRGKDIKKSWMPKDEAEKKYGFTLYQGGIVPGNKLRVVNIEGTDTEACCGTHADNTSEVGQIKLMRANRISDGIVRLEYCAGEAALKLINNMSTLLHQVTSLWGVEQAHLLQTAERFFSGYKQFSKVLTTQSPMLLELQLKNLLLDPAQKFMVAKSDESNPGLYIKVVPEFASRLKESGKGCVFVGEDFFYGLLGDSNTLDVNKEIAPLLTAPQVSNKQKKKRDDDKKAEKETVETKKEEQKVKQAKLAVNNSVMHKESKTKTDGITLFTATSVFDTDAVYAYLTEKLTGGSVVASSKPSQPSQSNGAPKKEQKAKAESGDKPQKGKDKSENKRDGASKPDKSKPSSDDQVVSVVSQVPSVAKGTNMAPALVGSKGSLPLCYFSPSC